MSYEGDNHLYHRGREQHCRSMAELASDPDVGAGMKNWRDFMLDVPRFTMAHSARAWRSRSDQNSSGR